MWVDFKGVPGHLFSHQGLGFVSSFVGHPLRLHPNTERCTRLDVARVLVAVDLKKTLPSLICLPSLEGDTVRIPVSYPWLPPRCHICNKWGHVDKNCVSPRVILQKQRGLEVALVDVEPSFSLDGVLQQAEAEGVKVAIHNGDLEDKSVTNDTVQLPLTVANPEIEKNDSLLTAEEGEWHTVGKSKSQQKDMLGAKLLNPEVALDSDNVSPSRFQVLASIRDEGELEDEDTVEEGEISAKTVDASINCPIRKPHAKSQRKHLMSKKELIYNMARNSNKNASSRKP